MSYLVYKIAYYIPILECLFTTDKSEVTQKVAERVAFYLGVYKDERKDIFDTIKDAYEIRSTFLHGQKFHAKNIKKEELEKLATRLDELIRAAFIMIIMSDSDIFLGKVKVGEKKDKRDDFLKYLIFE